MKRLTGQAWFVPAVIAVAIVGTLALYRNRDSLFGNSNEHGLTYIDMDKAQKMMENPEDFDSGNFVIVYGSASCGACKTFYGEIKTFRNSNTDASKKYKFYNIDIDATKDTNNSFWNEWIEGQSKYAFSKVSSGTDKFTTVSTPASIVVTGGDSDNRKCFSGSSNASEIQLELKNL